MKTLTKWILAGIAFALGVMAAEHCDASTIRQVRSLSAATVTGPGVGFTTQANPFYVPGGGIYWQVMITLGTPPNLSFSVEAQLSDGTWIQLVPPTTIVAANTGSAVFPYIYSFRGPFQDLRVNLITRTTGSITADIYVTY